jgi:alpha-mannosidase
MDILDARSTDLFVGTEQEPRQVVRVQIRGTSGDPREPARLTVRGERIHTETELTVGPLSPGEEARLEVGVAVEGPPVRDEPVPAEAVLVVGGTSIQRPFEFVIAEPGWRMFMIAHFHYDPVWWNTQAAYTEAWGAAIQYRQPFQEPGLALVKAHLEMARRDPDYKFVLAELDYLKPYWDVYPEDRAYIRRLLAEGRLELMGGTYNEPNTNLTSAESTIRNAIYGIGYQRDVLGGNPATAWQLDAFGHDPQFPGIMADAGVTSSSWARGPFHEWGPHWVRGAFRLPIADMAEGGPPKMQFTTEFDWIAPSGRALLTSFMANHYSSGWWMDSAATLEQAEAEVHLLFTELAGLAATKNVLLPVGTDYTPPNRWLTAIHRDWNARYVWPKFMAAIPREFFDAVRAERAGTGRRFSPQTRDMNPIYTGKDVSFIDTKQAQRLAENTLLAAEKFATMAGLLGARYPTEATDKAWRHLLFGAHHDGITGSESDQVYLDLLGGWRESYELGRSVLDTSLGVFADAIQTEGEGQAVVVFNPASWRRSDIVRVRLDVRNAAGVEILDDEGHHLPHLVEATESSDDGTIARATVAFLARDVPATGYRTFFAVPEDRSVEASWRPIDGSLIENDRFAVQFDPDRGGAITSIVDKRIGKELIRPGEVGNELRCYREYPNHPLFGEGPWHLTPDGRYSSSAFEPVSVVVEECPIGRRIRVEGPVEMCRRSQEVVLWDDIDRVEFSTTIDDYTGQDRLFRVRFPASVTGGRPVFEVGNAVIGRPFGTPNVDVAKVPFTLDNPAYNWFGLGSTALVELVDTDRDGQTVRAGRHTARALGVGEIVRPDAQALDDAVGDLVVALVRQGVTATVSDASGSRYGVLHIDSNLPDFRIALGLPADNRFVADVLEAAGDEFRREFERQLVDPGLARLWVPAADVEPAALEGLADLRGVLALPVLLVAGADTERQVTAVGSMIDDLDDGTITIAQPADLSPDQGEVENYTIALTNRGIPGSSVDSNGDLYLSLMRSSSGWPSGVWIDPPQRSAPDGSNFQFQHWTHHFEYAVVAGEGDWRDAGLVRTGHEFNNPLLARAVDPHAGVLPDTAELLAVDPATAVVTAMKPAGNPIAKLGGMDVDPRDGIALRIYETSGRPGRAQIRSLWPVTRVERTNATEERPDGRGGNDSPGNELDRLSLDPFEIATALVALDAPAPIVTRTDLGPRSEPAQPVYAQYWMHNKGPAPIGYQPTTVTVRPRFVRGPGPFRIEVVVASEQTTGAAAGEVSVVVPDGWEATPAGRLYQLAPGAHLSIESVVAPSRDAIQGRYFVAARITDDGGQIHEDVLTVDLEPAAARTDGAGGHPSPDTEPRESAPLAAAIVRAMRKAGLEDGAYPDPVGASGSALGGEVEVVMLTDRIELEAGEHAAIRVRLRNRAQSQIRGEAQLLSPHETWPSITPWTRGFVVESASEGDIEFFVDPPYDSGPGTYWALVKVMYFGRLHYTESIEVRINGRAAIEAGARPAVAERAAAGAGPGS